MRHTLPDRFLEAQRQFAADIMAKVNHHLGDSFLADVTKYETEGILGTVVLLRGKKPSKVGTVHITVSPTVARWTLETPEKNHMHGAECAVMKDADEISKRIVGDIRTFLPLPRDLATV